MPGRGNFVAVASGVSVGVGVCNGFEVGVELGVGDARSVGIILVAVGGTGLVEVGARVRVGTRVSVAVGVGDRLSAAAVKNAAIVVSIGELGESGDSGCCDWAWVTGVCKKAFAMAKPMHSNAITQMRAIVGAKIDLFEPSIRMPHS